MKLKYDPKVVKGALFRGKETEGPLRGIATLFVVGDVPIFQIQGELERQGKTHPLALYFGAGGWHTYNKETLRYFMERYPTLHITVESLESHLTFLFDHKFGYWIVPVCWSSECLPSLTHVKNILEFVRTEASFKHVLERMIVKYDHGDFVHCMKASDIVLSVSKDYQEDVELLVNHHLG